MWTAATITARAITTHGITVNTTTIRTLLLRRRIGPRSPRIRLRNLHQPWLGRRQCLRSHPRPDRCRRCADEPGHCIQPKKAPMANKQTTDKKLKRKKYEKELRRL